MGFSSFAVIEGENGEMILRDEVMMEGVVEYLCLSAGTGKSGYQQ